jgi:hypothetical protein
VHIFVPVLFHVKHLGVKPLIKKVFLFTAPSRRRPATPATARLQVQKSTCFDHFFTQKHQKTRESHQI